jgi:hypothetical protein
VQRAANGFGCEGARANADSVELMRWMTSVAKDTVGSVWRQARLTLKLGHLGLKPKRRTRTVVICETGF